MFQIEKYSKVFSEMLDELDDLKETIQSDGLEELNANFEDTLLLMESTSTEDEDWQEAIEDALCEFEDLAEEYRAFDDERINEIAHRLAVFSEMTRKNMNLNL